MAFAKRAEELLLNCDNDVETTWLKVLEVTGRRQRVTCAEGC